ncbi:glycine zipper 2TM domain-containing protein [Altererythrobacter aquiaggeris]|uniref:glycine zipper 2TM domain-containing protein n=1 Tax=Aestuarierythrobacter aquiaggeris TaxID=1898396 RepID=UPI0030180F9C
MSTIKIRAVALTLAAPCLALAMPAAAATAIQPAQHAAAVTHAPAQSASVLGTEIFEHGRKDKRWKRNRGHGHAYGNRDYNRDYRTYGEPVYRDTRIWRGDDGRYYCRRENGTTGLLIGAAVGGLIGNEVAGRGDRTLGAIIGAAGGAILGRSIDRSNSRCR